MYLVRQLPNLIPMGYLCEHILRGTVREHVMFGNTILLVAAHKELIMYGEVVCVCVCVFFPFILDIKFIGSTSRGHTGGRSHRISHPPSFCRACLNFSLEKDSAVPFNPVCRDRTHVPTCQKVTWLPLTE